MDDLLKTWQIARGVANKLENIPVNDLDSILQSFFAEIHKFNGSSIL